jgi:hypothetical protein
LGWACFAKVAANRHMRWGEILVAWTDGDVAASCGDEVAMINILGWTLLMALVVGVVGFVVGFFGPAIFMPDSNQGPLLGIFLTGPVGVVAGAVFGFIIGVRKNRRARQ